MPATLNLLKFLGCHRIHYVVDPGSISAPEPLHVAISPQAFPSLIEVDGVAAHEEEWRKVQLILHTLQKPLEPVDTSMKRTH